MIKTDDPMKRLILDIETSPIKGKVWGIRNQFLGLDQIDEPTRMLSVAAKWYGSRTTAFFSAFDDNPVDQFNMVKSIWELVDTANVLIHYNGKNFDMRHLNREFKEQGFDEPSSYQYIDLYKVVKSKFNLPSNKLEYVLRWLNLEGKVKHTGFTMWNEIHSPDVAVRNKARKLFKRYNIGDVVKTEFAYEELMGWIDNHPNMQLFVVDRPEGEVACPTCISTNIKMDGTAPRGNLSRVQRYRCKDCGRGFRGKATVVRAEER
jgi:uncharacterized protein